MNVRRARPEDVPAIVRLWRGMWDFHTPLDPRFQATPMANGVMAGWIEQNLENDRATVLVAEETPGDLEGYCLALILENPPVVPWPYYGHISEIASRKPRGGVGTLLLQAAHRWFRMRNIPYVEVNVSVKNEVAGGFWRKQGYGGFLERLRMEL